EFPFFEHHLKGKPAPALPKALVFETGTNRWRRESAWPPAGAAKKSLYFHPGGKLAFDRPPDEGVGFDEFVSSPANPVPHQGQIRSRTRSGSRSAWTATT